MSKREKGGEGKGYNKGTRETIKLGKFAKKCEICSDIQ